MKKISKIVITVITDEAAGEAHSNIVEEILETTNAIYTVDTKVEVSLEVDGIITPNEDFEALED